MNFNLHHTAIHFIDPKQAAPRLATRELVIDEDFPKADRPTVRNFLAVHLRSIWLDDTAHAADVGSESLVLANWEALLRGEVEFLETSRRLATLLHQASPQNATRGLLLAVEFTAEGADDRSLALIKLDPGDRDVLRLESEGDRILLDLAVEHVRLALPDPTGVLKWAILPHPTLPGVAAKLKDRQRSGVDAAAYFMRFLGAAARRRDHAAVNAVTSGIKRFLDVHHAGESTKRALHDVMEVVTDRLAEGGTVTAGTIAEIVKTTGGVEYLDEAALAKALSERDVVEVRLAAPTALADQTVTYVLDNGIRIKGRSAVMDTQLAVDEVDHHVVFTIRAGDYTLTRSR